jgi:SAM-dependent methyltransferase
VSADSKTRFSDRVGDYVKFRPSYPREAIDAILSATKASRVADLGSGTGISAKLFLERGIRVYGVEPNAEMRAAAERELAAFSNFTSVDGSAEKTTLADASVDLAIAAQSFHWFRPEETRVELARILAPPRWVALMWNERLVDTAFLRDYEAALREHSPDYAEVDHRDAGDRAHVGRFFRGPFETHGFPNAQRFDREGFIGRARSSSYVPKTETMMAALERVFDAHADAGHVEFRYLTQVHIGTLTA